MYDPVATGPLTVGVREGELVDAARSNRALPFVVWRPTEDGPHPLVLFSHTSRGHRRQSTFLTSHLASHGYVVGSVDHVGNTATDPPLAAEQRDAYVQQIIA